MANEAIVEIRRLLTLSLVVIMQRIERTIVFFIALDQVVERVVAFSNCVEKMPTPFFPVDLVLSNLLMDRKYFSSNFELAM